MASFDNLAPVDSWMFRSTVADPWYPEAFARETESALTMALQQSLFNHPISEPFSVNLADYGVGFSGPNRVIPDLDRNLNRCLPLSTAASVSTVTGSGSISGSGSDPETPGSKRPGSNLSVLNGKMKKRKSRATKRATTTYIQADPANFRQMVQQVTGVKLEENGKLPDFTVVKPEPLRQPFANKLQGFLPTLDTSAYLLDLQNSNTHRIPVSGSFPGRSQVTENGGGGGGAGVDFYSCSSFPTLESSN